jgi:tetratricopeptide (TPR) repeat protein
MKHSFIASLLIVLAGTLSAAPFELTRDFWRSQAFRDNFMGSYGFRTDVEPRITSEERDFFQELVPVIQENINRAIQSLSTRITADSSAALDFTLGNLHFQNGNLTEAIRHFNTSINKFPNFLRAHRNLALAYVQMDNHESALASFVKSIELGAADAITYGVLGFSNFQLGRFTSAENAYRMAMLFQPDNRDWKIGLMRSLAAMDRNAEAIGLLDELIAESPSNADFWLFQANLFLAMDRSDKASSNLEIINRMGRSTPQSLMLLGDIYVNENLYDLAYAAYSSALEQRGAMDSTRFLRAANILIRRNVFDQAEQFLDNIQSQFGDSLENNQAMDLLTMRSEVFLATGREAEAAETLEEIIAQDPVNGRALMTLAEYKWRQGDYEDATIFFERAARIDEFEVDALIQHARMRVSQRQFQDASALLRRAQLIRPRDNVASFLEAVESAARAAR